MERGSRQHVQMNTEIDTGIVEENYWPPQFPIATPNEHFALQFLVLIETFESKVRDMLRRSGNTEEDIEDSEGEGQSTKPDGKESSINMMDSILFEPGILICWSLIFYFVLSLCLYAIHYLCRSSPNAQDTVQIIFGALTGGILIWNYTVDFFLSAGNSIRLTLLPIALAVLVLVFSIVVIF